MKKWMTVLLALCLAVGIAGCRIKGPAETMKAPVTETTKAPESETTAAPEREDGTGLTVYYLSEEVSTARNIVNAYISNNPGVIVEAVAFESVAEMDQQITQELEKGKGPDVILFPDATTVDTAKLALNGRLLDLAPMLEEDGTFQREAYYPVLDAGVIGGGQYLMPLRMKIMHMMTTRERFVNRLALTQDYTVRELMEALLKDAGQCGPEENAAHTTHNFNAYLYDLLRLTGAEILDPDRLSQTLSEEILREYAVFARGAYSQCLNAAKQSQEYGFDNMAEALRRNTVILSDQSFPVWLRSYGAVYSTVMEEEIQMLVYPGYENREELTADISLYAVVLNTTDKPWEAYGFIRAAMDNSFSNINEQLPVSREGADRLVTLLGMSAGKTFFADANKVVSVGRMTPEHQEGCRAVLERITAGSIPNAKVEKIFYDTMMPYITGEAGYDACCRELRDELALYLDEVYER